MHHPGNRKRDLISDEDLSVAAKLEKADIHENLKLKQDSIIVSPKPQPLKTKVVPKVALTGKSAPRPQTVGRRYPTRRSTRLITRLSNTLDDPVVLVEDDSPLVSKQLSPNYSSAKYSDSDEAFEADLGPAILVEGSSHNGNSGVKLTDDPDVSEKRTHDFLADYDAFVLRKFSSTT
ncbi:uncharacterized protein LOC142521471 [Primulina tabacum]|uniref:uncharacterized protein LOC142521471 n=1 Tax=Primulina tabacum TaxID=48773 RepID=UPI003F5A2D92